MFRRRLLEAVQPTQPRPCSQACAARGTCGRLGGGGGGAENRNAPKDTAALSFVENSEAARYIFVVVVIGDVMNLAVVTTLLCWRDGLADSNVGRRAVV